ncbi:MAG: Ig-like domain-containing protein [Clostridia bacterium]|nr:Ig-like domain-containing protein [Clostridia bacterium]
MKMKKLLSVLLTICMMVQILPIISAGATEVTTESASNINYIINDTFDDGFDGWQSASITHGGASYNDRLTLDSAAPQSDPEVTVMHFASTGTAFSNTSRPNLYYNFENPVEFSENKTVVVKARVMYEGGTENYTTAYLKVNRPVSTASYSVSEISYRPYNVLTITSSGVASPKTEDKSFNYNQLITDTISGKWLDIEMVFDGTPETRSITVDGTTKTYTSREGYTLSVKTDDMSEYATMKGTLANGAEAYTLAGLDPTADDFAGFTSLNSLNFVFDVNASDLYVDYVQVYEINVISATASLENTKVLNTDDINLVFEAEGEIAEIPEGAVELKDNEGAVVAATTSYDSATKTLSINPESDLKVGGSYKVTVDAAAFEDLYINYTGEAEFAFTAIGEGGLVLRNTFDDGDLGDWALNLGTNSADNISLTADTTTDGLEVMKLTKVAKNGYHHNQVGYAYLKLPQRLEFEEGKSVVIKARVMQSLPEGITSNDVAILANAPAKITNVGARGSNAYVLASVTASSVNVPKSESTREETTKIIKEVDTNNQWVDFEIVFDGSELTSTITGDDGFTITHRDGYKVTAKMGEQSATSPVASLFHNIGITSEYPGAGITRGQGYKNAYTEAGYTDFTAENFHSFEGLDSLAFLLNRNADNVYVDYVEIYEKEIISATAELEKAKILNTEDVKLTFTSEADIDSIPAGAVTLKDKAGNTVSAAQTFDATTKTLTINPDTDLRVGGIYKVNVDAAAFDSIFVTYTGETEFTVTAIGENGLIINDTFDDGSLGGWFEGASTLKNNGQTTFGIVDGAMTLTTSAKSNTNGTSHANMRYEFAEPLEFKDDSKIVIETRVKFNDPGADNKWLSYDMASMQINRPADYSIFGSTYTDWYYFNAFRINGGKLLAPYCTRLDYDSINLQPEGLDSAYDKWIDIKIVFDGTKSTPAGLHPNDVSTREGYTIIAKIEGQEESVSSWASLFQNGKQEIYDAYNTTTKDGFKSIESITFPVLFAIGTYAVDYVRVYEIESADAYATMPAGNTVKYDEAIKLNFYGVHPAVIFPTNAVTLKTASGATVETVNTYDAATGILSVKPVANLTKGEYYSVNVNKGALSKAAMNYVGTTYFTVTARDDFETAKVVLNDDFNDNTTQGWVAGNALDTYGATVTAEDGMLHVTTVGMGYSKGSESSVTKLLGDGIELTEGKKVVIKTKVKNVTEGATWVLNLNRPEDISNLPSNANLWSVYQLVRNSTTDITVPANKRESLQGPYNNFVWSHSLGEKRYNEETGKIENLETIDTLNKWVEYTITITDEEINNLHVKADILDDNGNIVATHESDELNDATIKTSFDAGERVFGKVPGYSTVEDAADPEKKAVMDNMFNKWLSADRLTFSTGKYNTPMEYYIDYITVEQLDAREVETTATASLTVGGVATQNIAAGDSVIPAYTLQGNTGTAFTVISAMYVDGKLSGAPHINTVTAENSDEFTYTETEGFTVPSAGKVEIKAFVWNALDGLKPIGGVAKAAND